MHKHCINRTTCNLLSGISQGTHNTQALHQSHHMQLHLSRHRPECRHKSRPPAPSVHHPSFHHFHNTMSCATEIAGIPLSSCIYNASGPRTGSVEALLKIAASRSGCVLSKSATLLKQDGNPMPRFVNKIALGKYCEGSINAEGLPNQGIGYCKPLCLQPSLPVRSFVFSSLTCMQTSMLILSTR